MVLGLVIAFAAVAAAAWRVRIPASAWLVAFFAFIPAAWVLGQAGPIGVDELSVPPGGIVVRRFQDLLKLLLWFWLFYTVASWFVNRPARRAKNDRDLSVSYNKIGDVRVGQGDLKAALQFYSDSRAIAERLAKSDLGNAEWQRDLSVSYNRIGDVQVAQGDLKAALQSYSDSRAIAERFAKSDPGNAEWQRDLSVSYAKLADIYIKSGDKAHARVVLDAGRALVGAQVKDHPDRSEWKSDLNWFDSMLAELEEAAPPVKPQPTPPEKK